MAANLAAECEIQLAYAIGVAQPVSIALDTFGTETVAKSRLIKAVSAIFDLTPRGIMKALDLKKPTYYKTSVFGHFGRKNVP